MRSYLATMLLIVVVTAGCADAEPSRSPTTPLAATKCDPCPAPEASIPLPALQSISFSQCYKISHTLAIRNEVWNPTYPSNVTPATTPGTPVHAAALIYWHCRQALVVDEVDEDLRMVFFVGAIEPPTTAARNDSFSMYVFQAYTDSARFAAELSSRYGFELSILELLDPERSSLSPDPEPSELYEIQVGEAATPDYRVEGQLRTKETADVQSTDAYYFVNSTGALSGFRFDWEGSIGPSSGGTISFGPGSAWAKQSDVTSYPHVNVYSRDITGSIQLVPFQ